MPKCLLLPSLWYENCPKTLIEAYAKGTPVLASRLGAMQEMVEQGRTGMLFEPGNVDDLVRNVEELMAANGRLQQMRPAARSTYEQKYSTEGNYAALMEIYRRALGRHEASATPTDCRTAQARTPLGAAIETH